MVCKEYGCGVRIPMSEMKVHLEKDCLYVKKRAFLSLKSRNRPVLNTGSIETDELLATDKYIGDSNIHPIEFDLATPPMSPIEQLACPDCGEHVLKGKVYFDHRDNLCRMRKVFCPNHSNGCLETLPISQIDNHLKDDCIYEKNKVDLISKSKLRNELVMCTGCGELIPLRYLRQHETDLCSNRYSSSTLYILIQFYKLT